MPKGREATLTPLDRLRDLTRRLVAVPKAEIDKRARAYRKRKKPR